MNITEQYMREQGFAVVDSDTKPSHRGGYYRKWQKDISRWRTIEFIHLDYTRGWTLCDGENRLRCYSVADLNNAMRFINVDYEFPKLEEQ